MSRWSFRLRRAAPYLGLLALNFWLFAPRFFTSQAGWLPLLPPASQQAPEEVPFYRYPLLLLAQRDNLDMFRVSVELLLATLILVWTARSRQRRTLRIVATTLYVLLWVFLAYHHGVAHFYERKPALFEDIRLTLNLWHFVSGYAHYGILVVLGVLLYLALLSWLVATVFRALQLRAAEWSRRSKLQVSAALFGPALVSLVWLGTKEDTPVWQLPSKVVSQNIRASVREARRMAGLRSAPPDLRYEAFSKIHLQRKPDVYLIMVEAYGEILSTWDMNDAYRALMARVDERLAHAGYHSASIYSASPVHGGTSWFAISTVHTGIKIDRPQAYDELLTEGARIPSITRFFREQGYLTHSLQPGVELRTGLNRFDVFNHEINVDAPTIAYSGPEYGWGVIPDQYSIGVFREKYFKPTPQPRYAFFMCVSTHFAWENVPHYVSDYKTLAQGVLKPDDYHDHDETWPPFPPALIKHIATATRREYFRSVEYEWRLLTEWFEAEAKRGSVILVVGDHQPRLEWDVPGGVTMNTPVHIISQDAALVERFKAQGFQQGMYALPHTGPSLEHEGLFSLLLTQLSAAYATPDSPKGKYYPEGLPLAGLNR